MKNVCLLLLLLVQVAKAETYVTTFPLTENPISEVGRWICGKTVGLDWTDVSTNLNKAHGNYSPSNPRYTDPTALLTGNWGPNQTVQAVVYSINPTNVYYQEVELRLRSAIVPHSITGYEIGFRCLKTSEGYAFVARWNGAVGNFTALASVNGAQYGVATGDVVKATITGNIIRVFINQVQVIQVTDSTFATGRPGIGFNYGVGNTNSDFGFSMFSASDQGPPPPLSLNATVVP